MYSLALRGGSIVSDTGTARKDVFVTGGVISAIADPDNEIEAERTVDLHGKHVLPGIIDAHTHFRTWSKHSDSLSELAVSAAYGGVTSLCGFVMGMHMSEHDLLGRIGACRAEGASGMPIDFGFHAAIAAEPGTVDQIPEAIDRGVTTFKMFMINRARKMMVDDAFLHTAMRRIADHGGLAMVHAELEDVVGSLSAQLRGNTDDIGLFTGSRPAWVEAEATRRALRLAADAGCPLYVVHVTCEAALDEIRAARQRGQTVFAETCPQYLTLTEADQRAQQGLAKVAPPLRTERDCQVLADAVLSGEIDVVSSDHAPYEKSVKSGAFAEVPVGMPGTETLLPVTWKAISDRGGSLNTLVRVLATSPAETLGIPGKGRIDVGYDADFTVIDTAGETVIDGSALHSTAGYSCFDGWTAPLRVENTFLRGEPLLEKGSLPEVPAGVFLPRRQGVRG
ncbi:dihydroorotase [Amycolatopsis jejuensis]|uniref:dihydroorotase n=1 Tax=Amycolatopsis jejuensis TaxID=330084 RepID=UPI000527492C|nr:amidohydrolase family protein [Amycolatopsis jejuensis]